MATISRIRSGYDSWVGSGDPTSKHPKTIRLRLQDGAKYAYLYFPLGPELRNVTILSATLHMWGRDTGWGSQTLTARRITGTWDAATLTWKDRPAVGDTTATLTQGNPADPTEWALDVTSLVQEFAGGARWRGMRLEITSSTEVKFNSLNAGGRTPWLEVVWTDAPAAPVDLAPSGSRAVSESRPTLAWSNENSPDGTSLTAFQVQVDADADGVAPEFDSGEIVSDLAELDLSVTAYAGLSNLAATQWRVRVRDDAGLWSDWSDWAAFTHVDKGIVTILTPGSTVVEYTPPVAWSTTLPQSSWRIQVFDAEDAETPLHNTGRKTGATQDYTIPAEDPDSGKRILVDGRDYILYVDVWDDVDREATPGQPRYSRASVVFNYADDPTPDPVTSLGAQTVGLTPYVDLMWQRDTTPDGWTILVDDKVVETNIDGADLLIGPTSYKYRYKDATPGWHSFKVKPKVNAKTAASPTVSAEVKPAGTWVMGPDDTDVWITGRDLGDFSMPDRGTTFTMPGSRSPVRITQGVGGYAGTITGQLVEGSGRTALGWRKRLLTLKKRGGRATLYVGGEVFRAVIFNINVSPSRTAGQTYDVSFDFFQVGAIDWLD